MKEEIKIEEWAVLTASAGARYLGKVSEGPNDLVHARNRLEKGIAMTLSVAFDFQMVVIQQGNQPVRAPMIGPLDLTTSPFPFVLHATGGYFCADLSETDKLQYVNLIENAFKAMTTARAKRSGLTV